jgi:hypothetical protein
MFGDDTSVKIITSSASFILGWHMDEAAVALLREIRDLLAADEAKRERYLEQVRRLNDEQRRDSRKNLLLAAVVFAFFMALGVFVGVRIGLAAAILTR